MARKATPSDNLKIIEKIPLFRGLSLNQVHQLLDASQMTTYPKDRLLCLEGDKSTDMFILLAGQLVVRKEDVELARVTPVEVIGEMGMVTSQPRSATVQVVEEATVLWISKMKFEVVLKNDADAAAKIYRNMLVTLCQRLRETNARLSQDPPETDQNIEASLV